MPNEEKTYTYLEYYAATEEAYDRGHKAGYSSGLYIGKRIGAEEAMEEEKKKWWRSMRYDLIEAAVTLFVGIIAGMFLAVLCQHLYF